MEKRGQIPILTDFNRIKFKNLSSKYHTKTFLLISLPKLNLKICSKAVTSPDCASNFVAHVRLQRLHTPAPHMLSLHGKLAHRNQWACCYMCWEKGSAIPLPIKTNPHFRKDGKKKKKGRLKEVWLSSLMVSTSLLFPPIPICTQWHLEQNASKAAQE